MAKNVIFLVHGVGRHEEGWTTGENGPVSTLVDAANYYNGFSEQSPLTDSVEFIEIRYDDIFDKILSRWAELVDSLGNLPEATPQAISEVRDKIAGQVNPDNWFAGQAMDVAFYTGFKLVRRLVQLRVATKIMKTVSDYSGEEDRKYGLIAHSLGTTVAHDAIHRMGTTAWLANTESALEALNAVDEGTEAINIEQLKQGIKRYGRKPFAPGKFKFDAIYMISNTSKLLHRDTPSPKDSIVRPSFSKDESVQKNACLRFFNIDHVLDPVSKISRFCSEEVWRRSASKKNAKDIFNVKHVHNANVHSLTHYLNHPLVHREIFSTFVPHRFTFDDFIKAKLRLSAGGDFPKWGEKYLDEDKQDKLEKIYDKIHLDDQGKDIAELLLALPQIIDELKDLFEA